MPATGDRDGPRPWVTVALTLAIVAEGLVAARQGYLAFQFQAAVLAVAAGWIAAVAGLLAWQRAPASRVGPLLVAAGAAVFLPALERSVLDLASAHLQWIAAAIVAHAILTAPTGRADDRGSALAIAAVYGVAAAMPLDGVGVAAMLLVALGLRRRHAAGERRRRSGEAAGLLLAAGLAAGPLLEQLGAGLPVNQVALQAAALTGAALMVAAAAVREVAVPARVTDLVLRLDTTTTTSITDELRRLTGDPGLEVAYPLPAGGFADALGRRLRLPGPDDRRVITELAQGSGIRMIHDRRLDADRPMRHAIARAAELAAANVRLLGELRTQAAEVRASQVRLLEAEAVERSAVGERLRSRLDPILDGLAADLADGGPDGIRLAAAEVRAEVHALAEGLGPRALAGNGLADALAGLARRSPVPVSLAAEPLPPLGPAIEATGWFVCNEALANVAKHAAAGRVDVSAGVADGQLLMVVADDGAGGADLAGGSGLLGMRDRVEAVGGRLEVTSSPGSGTTVRASLPLGIP